MSKTIYIERYGCTRRNAEITKLERYFRVNDFTIAKTPVRADYILLSTCAFKGKEEQYSLKRIEQLRKYAARMIVYGCLPDIAPAKYMKYKNIEHVSPKNIEEIDAFFEDVKVRYADLDDVNMIEHPIRFSPLTTAARKFSDEFQISNTFLLRTARYVEKRIKKILSPNSRLYYLYICKGCYGKCSYCAIRRAIGPLKSASMENIIQQFERGMQAGYTQYVLLGDDVGAYGRDNGATLPGLLTELIGGNGKKTGKRNNGNHPMSFHVEEMHPKWIICYEDALLKIIETKTIKSILCPLQSGSNRILGLMQREHTVEDISRVLRRIKRHVPELRLTTQIIVGFPSETGEDLERTTDAIGKIGFDEVTIFPYDEKEGTPATNIVPKIADDQRDDRIERAILRLRKNRIKTKLSCI